MPHFDCLRERTCRANRAIVAAGLVVLTFGNASAFDADLGVMAIKPSGVDYDELLPDDLVLIDVESGEVVEGDRRPSSDTPTHLELYRAFPALGGVVHTHSTYATAWAQAGRSLPCLGTTHADHFHGPVPVTRGLLPDEIWNGYERCTGLAIVEAVGADALDVPAVLVASHGPFTWGATVEAAVENAIALEQVARTALLTLDLSPIPPSFDRELLERHHSRKHGPGAYYGQPA